MTDTKSSNDAAEYAASTQSPASTSRANALAVAGFVTSFAIGVAGIVCGVIALAQLRKRPARGRALAIWAVVIGALNLAAGVVVVVATTNSVVQALSSMDLEVPSWYQVPRSGWYQAPSSEVPSACEQMQMSLQAFNAVSNDARGLSALVDAVASVASSTEDPVLARAAGESAENLRAYAAYATPLFEGSVDAVDVEEIEMTRLEEAAARALERVVFDVCS